VAEKELKNEGVSTRRSLKLVVW